MKRRACRDSRGFLLGRLALGILCCGALPLRVIGQERAAKAQDRVPVAPGAARESFLTQFDEAVTDLVGRVKPLVVTIEGRAATFRIPVPARMRRILPDDEKQKLSPDKLKEYEEEQRAVEQATREALQTASRILAKPVSGSGFVISGGFVVTTAEVTERMRDPFVVFSDGKKIKAEWTYSDKAYNIAVLKISGLPSDMGLKWGDSGKTAAGNFALTIGDQSGFAQSVSWGLISGTGRAGRSGRWRYDNLLQFQGAVGAGGSGGPLLNARGDLVGMMVATPALTVTALVSPSKAQREQFVVMGEPEGDAPPAMPVFTGVSNLGFALPADEIRPIVEQLKRREPVEVRVGWLGVRLPKREMTDDPQPAQIEGIYVGGPADQAGLQPGDLVLAINGEPVTSTESLRLFAKKVGAGEAIRLQIRRNGKTLTLILTAEKRPNERVIEKMQVREMSSSTG